MQAHSLPATGRARDAVDIEGYVRGFGRRRPDVRVVVPRFAAIIGPTVRTPLTRYFSLSPFVPVVAGHDARLQLVHEDDAVALMEHLVLGDFAGIVNVAGDGAMSVAQAIHRAGRLPLPIPSPALGAVGRALGVLGVGGFSVSQVRDLAAGRVMDTARLRTDVGFRPRYSTVDAFDDFVAALTPALPRATVRAAEERIAAAVGVAARPLPVASPLRPVVDVPPADPPPRPRLVSIPGDGAGRPGAPRRGSRTR